MQMVWIRQKSLQRVAEWERGEQTNLGNSIIHVHRKQMHIFWTLQPTIVLMRLNLFN